MEENKDINNTNDTTSDNTIINNEHVTNPVVTPNVSYEQPKSYININNLKSRSNGVTVGSKVNSDSLENMDEERRAYLLEKEARIAKSKKRKKAIIKNLSIFIFLFVLLYGYQYYFRPVEIDERIDKNSIHYLTDLYYSDGRYYDEYLNDQAKKIYLDIFDSLKNYKSTLKLDCTDYGYSTKAECASDVSLSLEIILLEHPDMFWYRYSSFRYGDSIGIEISNHYVSTNRIKLFFVEKRLLRKLDELTKEYEGLSDYEKIESVYTWLGANKPYSDGIIRTRKDGTAWSALLDDDTVCAGYAAASQLLFQRMGIKSTVVTGNTSGPHAWNFVYLEDGYYWYDATVGGSVGKDSSYFYNGLLFSDNGKYSVDVLDLEYYSWGSKYLER